MSGPAVTAFCNTCGATRPAKAQGVPHREAKNLRCDNCQRVTPHVRLHAPGYVDYGEYRNAKANAERSAPLVS